jgi:hypothetical protein
VVWIAQTLNEIIGIEVLKNALEKLAVLPKRNRSLKHHKNLKNILNNIKHLS